MVAKTPPLHVLASVAEELPPFYVCAHSAGTTWRSSAFSDPREAVKARWVSVPPDGIAWIENAQGVLIGDRLTPADLKGKAMHPTVWPLKMGTNIDKRPCDQCKALPPKTQWMHGINGQWLCQVCYDAKYPEPPRAA